MRRFFFYCLLVFLITSTSIAGLFPTCAPGKPFDKKVFYDPDTKALKYCLNGIWSTIDINGEKGETGDAGKQGAKGPAGDRGAGISSVTINESGNFVFVYGDGVSCTTTVGP